MVDVEPRRQGGDVRGSRAPADLADDVAAAVDDDMGRCILRLYRTGAQPAGGELGRALADMDLPPGLVIGAELDAYVPFELGNDVARQLGAEVLPLEGRGHWWMVDDLDPVADALVAFWSAH